MPADPLARGLAARANSADGIAAAGGALAYGVDNAYPDFATAMQDIYAQSMTGTGRTRIAFVGDSTTRGQGAGADTNQSNGGANYLTDLYQRAMPARFQQMMAQAGYPAIRSSWWGTGNFDMTELADSDARLNIASGWGAATIGGLGAYGLVNTTTTNSLTFTPEEPVDTFVVWYRRTTGSADMQAGSGAVTTKNMNDGSSSYMQSVVISSGAAATTTTLSITRNSGTVEIRGIEAYDSTKSQIMVANMGWPGSRTTTWIADNTPSYPLGCLLTGAQDPTYVRQLWFINLGINDQTAEVTPAEVATNIATLINTIRTTKYSSVVLVWHYENSSFAAAEPWRAAYRQCALDNNVPFIDLTTRLPTYDDAKSYAAGVGYDWFYDSSSHYNGKGYTAYAREMFRFVQSFF